AQIIWETPDDLDPGTYRITHFGQVTAASGEHQQFEAISGVVQIN
ncbi:MAG: neutral/alkaline non-lysosomal ceramidase C-terminal domain-containing protein, partial [Robiginitomaculum sp.]|nr:neutral/alkaline non-lysosomal ceramidase C-terminal domain-containing protein [Robiginitomaculum sp.]